MPSRSICGMSFSGMPENTAKKPPLDSEYTPEALAACEKALRTILVKIGPWGSRVALIGGLVPRYLVPTAPPPACPRTSDRPTSTS